MKRRLLLLAPLGLAAVAGGSFYAMLSGMKRGTFDPRGIPSQMIDKPLPDFELPGFSRADVLAAGKPVLINFFASWCLPCIEEAPTLMKLRQARVPLWGIAYKDKHAATDAFLVRQGNPFAHLAHDDAGTVGIEWGITGVPETFGIDGAGIVRWHFSGPLPAEAAAALATRFTS
jgi:cytochrome c biogenesis protein CcmG/thiol:disulfide interchange protein DsbE